MDCPPEPWVRGLSERQGGTPRASWGRATTARVGLGCAGRSSMAGTAGPASTSTSATRSRFLGLGRLLPGVRWAPGQIQRCQGGPRGGAVLSWGPGPPHIL